MFHEEEREIVGNRRAMVRTDRPKGDIALDVLRSKRVVERGLQELERSRTILHVDGHGFIQKAFTTRVAAQLMDLHVNVVSKTSSANAMPYLRDHRVDLIVSSSLVECRSGRSREDGTRFLRTCKELFPDTPFIVYTAPDGGDEDRSLADAVVLKSANFSELLENVRRLLIETGVG